MSDIGTREQGLLIDQLARRIVRRGWGAPALFLLEINKPFSFLGSQLLWMLQPLLGPVIDRQSVATYARLLEDPTTIDRLLARLEKLQAKEHESTQIGGMTS